MEQTRKALPTLGVMGVYSGICLSNFGEIHETMDHFYPGIMQLGCAMMAKTASKEVLRQIPGVAGIEKPEDWKTGHAEYAQKALARFGPTIELTGPHGTGEPDMIDIEASMDRISK